MTANQVFYNFLQVAYPEVSKSFRKTKNGIYETYSSLKKIGHKFIYNPLRQEISHMYYQPIYVGNMYEKKMVIDVVKVIMSGNGFKTIKI